MKYALLIYIDPSSLENVPAEDRERVTQRYEDVAREPGVIGGEQLQPEETATVVRTSGGDVLTTDGPFAETKEVLGGFYLLEADNLDRALEVAAKIPATWMGGAVEVRPIMERAS